MVTENVARKTKEFLGITHDAMIMSALVEEPGKLEAVNTFERCLGIFNNTPEGSELKAQALEKAFALASTASDWRLCFKAAAGHPKKMSQCIRAVAALLEKDQAPSAH